jgi:uncharacterized protein YecT (DUF1311 family)
LPAGASTNAIDIGFKNEDIGMRVSFPILVIFAPCLLANATAKSPLDKAVEKRYTEAYRVCMEEGPAAQGIQPAMNACAADEHKRQDDRLNQTYARVIGRQKPPGKKQLLVRQRAWIKARDRQCAAQEKEYEGGSMAPLIFHTCMTDETIKRTLWLEAHR